MDLDNEHKQRSRDMSTPRIRMNRRISTTQEQHEFAYNVTGQAPIDNHYLVGSLYPIEMIITLQRENKLPWHVSWLLRGNRGTREDGQVTETYLSDVTALAEDLALPEWMGNLINKTIWKAEARV